MQLNSYEYFTQNIYGVKALFYLWGCFYFAGKGYEMISCPAFKEGKGVIDFLSM